MFTSSLSFHIPKCLPSNSSAFSFGEIFTSLSTLDPVSDSDCLYFTDSIQARSSRLILQLEPHEKKDQALMSMFLLVVKVLR